AQPSASQSSNSIQTQELESDDEQLPEHAIIEAEGPTESISKYLADLYKAASDTLANTAKVIQYEIKCWYNYANKFKNRVKELIKTGVREKVARTAVYEEIEPFLL
ncbi:39863_t:CDS:2, partial [Gigaspora margarita]